MHLFAQAAGKDVLTCGAQVDLRRLGGVLRPKVHVKHPAACMVGRVLWACMHTQGSAHTAVGCIMVPQHQSMHTDSC